MTGNRYSINQLADTSAWRSSGRSHRRKGISSHNRFSLLSCGGALKCPFRTSDISLFHHATAFSSGRPLYLCCLYTRASPCSLRGILSCFSLLTLRFSRLLPLRLFAAGQRFAAGRVVVFSAGGTVAVPGTVYAFAGTGFGCMFSTTSSPA